jgi:hypothetical protein
MPAGRPRIISSPEEMLTKGYEYFEDCRTKEQHILVTGLVLALGLSSRESLIEYGNRPEYSDAVKELKSVCENYAENRLFSNNPTGAIFALKNYGWKDKTEQALTGADGGAIQAAVTVEFVGTRNSEPQS